MHPTAEDDPLLYGWQMSAGGPEQWDGTLHEMYEVIRVEHAKPDGWRGLTISHYSDL